MLTIASDEQDAIRQTMRKAPDMILLDTDELTQKDFSVILKLKKYKVIPNVPILFLTSIDNQAPVPEYLHYYNIDFITKPFRQKELLIRIKHQLLLSEALKTIRKQQKKLKQTMESRDKLYSIIAHDLRSPIGTIKMINAAIENKKDQLRDPEIRKLFEMISTTTEETFNLLENLLKWSNKQGGINQINTKVFNISVATRQVISLFTTVADIKKIILCNYVKGNIFVCADEDMIKTVLRNLISNAIKFTFSGGKIEISLSEDPNNIVISVKDNGRGIKKEYQEKLLKKSEHISLKGTQNESGNGLGLLLCKDFIKQNKGKLWFTSEEKNGSTFYFSVPKAASIHR